MWPLLSRFAKRESAAVATDGGAVPSFRRGCRKRPIVNGSIKMGTIERLHVHRNEILRLAAAFGTRNVRLFDDPTLAECPPAP
jgi:hypothetical protein